MTLYTTVACVAFVLVGSLLGIVTPARGQTGACCQFGNVCVARTQCDCRAGGNVFMGPGTACSPNPCNNTFGACCIGSPVIGCVSTVQAICTAIGGAWHSGQGCNSGFPPCFGGIRESVCCCGASCIITDPALCAFAGGTSFNLGSCSAMRACCDLLTGQCSMQNPCACVGANQQLLVGSTTCSPNPCPLPPTGRCCTSTGCGQTIQSSCSGSWSSGGSCMATPCGVCCVNGVCSVTLQASCTGNWGPPSSTCTTAPCGTCCTGSTCASTTQTNCTGAWSAGGSCTSTPCGACCTSGVCSYVTSPLCGGVFTAGGACSPNPCPMVGSCCSTSGVCSTVTQAQCLSQFGATWNGGGTTCINDPCGTCCNSGTCQVVTQTTCIFAAGAWSSGGSCNATPCGSCCFPASGSCSYVTSSQCSGVFTPGGVCAPNPCGPTGACCDMLGGCTMQTQTACTGLGGTWLPGVSCVSISACFGACCDVAGGSCTFTAPTSCPASPTQAFLGIGTTCLAAPACAALGACCDDFTGRCSLRTAIGCIGGAPTTFLGAGTVCVPNSCPPPPGACCDYCSRSCIVTLPAGCAPAAGFFLGGGTGCAPDPCIANCCVMGTPAPCSATQIPGCVGPGANWWPVFGTCPPSVQHIFNFLGDYFAGVLRADCDSNCALTVNDIFCFLAQYFSGCGYY